MMTALPSHLTDDVLLAEVQRLAGCERQATAQLVAHLAVIEQRRLYLGAGFTSLFAYCLDVLHLSEHATYNRIEAARAVCAFPAVLDRLADGSVTLTTVRLLAPHLTSENHERLLREATHKRKDDVLALVARIAPKPDVATSIRRVPVRRTAPPGATPALPQPAPAAPASEPVPTVAQPTASRAGAPRNAVVAPLAPERYEVRFTASASTREKLRHAQNLLRHAVPSGDVAEVVDRALTVLIADLERRKHAATSKPGRPRHTSRNSRHIPAEVRRSVWARDGGQCAFVGDGGRRCDATALLEFHHVTPWEAFGPATVDNIQLRCAAHNRHEARLYFDPIKAARHPDRVGERGARYDLSRPHSTRSRTSWAIPNP
jgi:hypothetical protein